MTLYAFRAPVVHVRSRYGSLSREIFLLMNNVLLVAATLLVLVGTLYPLVLDYLDMGRLSIGEPFFNLTFSPWELPPACCWGQVYSPAGRKPTAAGWAANCCGRWLSV